MARHDVGTSKGKASRTAGGAHFASAKPSQAGSAGSHAGSAGMPAGRSGSASGGAAGSRAARGSEPHAAGVRPVEVASGEKRDRSFRRRVVFSVVGVLIVLLVGVAGAALWYISSINASLGFDSQEEMDTLRDALIETKGDEPFYALILGSDARGNEASRSDVTMLVRIDPGDGAVTLVSIPRDTMVTLEGHGTQKINAAYAYGGAAGAVECVSEFAGVPISHYIEVHFEELEKVVDAVGGIEVDVPEPVSVSGVTIPAGVQTLSGKQALAFARDRHHVSGGDFGRAQAQRVIVEALARKVLSSSPTELPGIVSELAKSVSTDYDVSGLVSLAQKFLGKELKFYSAACPSYTLNQDGVSYVATMFDEWREVMQRVDAGVDPADDTAEIPSKQSADEKLGAASNSPAPRDYEQLAANAMTTDDVA